MVFPPFLGISWTIFTSYFSEDMNQSMSKISEKLLFMKVQFSTE
jgi:hypothetical protein